MGKTSYIKLVDTQLNNFHTAHTRHASTSLTACTCQHCHIQVPM